MRPPSNPRGRRGYPHVPTRSPEPKRSGSFLRPHVCSAGRTGPPNPVSRCCLWSPPHRSPAMPSHRCHDVATGRHINSNERQLSQGYRPLPGAEPGSLWVRGGQGYNSRWVSQQDAGEKGGRLRRPKSHRGQFLVSSGGPSKVLSDARIRTDQSVQPLK